MTQPLTLIVKNEVTKSLIAPGIGVLAFLFTFLPETILSNTLVTEGIKLGCLFLVILWALYAFIIKRKEWILVEKKSNT